MQKLVKILSAINKVLQALWPYIATATAGKIILE